METVFVGRERELAALGAEFDSAKPSLVVIFGRRRVGKSTLLQKALEGRRHVYFQATRVTDADSQALLRNAIAQALGPDPLLAAVSGWEGIFAYLVSRVGSDAEGGLVVALDEFPYLCEDNKALPSILQKVWDEVRRSGVPLKLVLCGSAVAFMEDLLAERNPLHGRQSRDLEVGPLPYREAAKMLPGWGAEEALRGFGVFGGMPYYLSLCDPAEDLAANVHRLVLDDGAPLRDEPMHLLQAELQSPARYASILRAVADGLTERGDIVNRVMHKGEQSSSITPYIDRLERMRLLRRMWSMDVQAPEKSRNTRYFLDDPFLSFHFRFVLPNLSALQSGHADAVWKLRIEPYMDDYMGLRFEEICRTWVALYGQEKLGVPAGPVGKIWSSDYDVDVAGELLDGRRVAGECKWWKKPAGINVLADLRSEAAKNRYYAGSDPVHLVFARNGFTPELAAIVQRESDVLLLGLADLLESRTT
ncbi:MAG TPA: ATP-binding protein [Longimicrobium sp.]